MAKDYSFDVVCRTDMQEVANAVNQASKEIGTRYDFKGSKSSVTLDDGHITLIGDDDFKLRLVREIINGKLVKRGISLKNLKEQKKEAAAGELYVRYLNSKMESHQSLQKKLSKRSKVPRLKSLLKLTVMKFV